MLLDSGVLYGYDSIVQGDVVRMKLTDDQLYGALRGPGPLREEAIVELRAILLRGMSRALRNRYGGGLSAEDIVQDALIKVMKSLDRFQGRSKFTTWAMTIATRVGISALRRKYHSDQSLDVFRTDDGGKIELALSDSSTAEASQSKRELIQILQQLIDETLTARQRIVVRAFLSDFSTDGIASAMGSNRNSVYKLLHDARTKLKQGLEAAGYSAGDVFDTLAAAGDSAHENR